MSQWLYLLHYLFLWDPQCMEATVAGDHWESLLASLHSLFSPIYGLTIVRSSTVRGYGYAGSTASCCICCLHLQICVGCTDHLQAVVSPCEAQRMPHSLSASSFLKCRSGLYAGEERLRQHQFLPRQRILQGCLPHPWSDLWPMDGEHQYTPHTTESPQAQRSHADVSNHTKLPLFSNSMCWFEEIALFIQISTTENCLGSSLKL